MCGEVREHSIVQMNVELCDGEGDKVVLEERDRSRVGVADEQGGGQ